MSPRPTIAIDFDGTLCEFQYPGIGPPKRYAREALEVFRNLGYRILIYSCRTSHRYYEIFGGDPSQPTMERERVKEMVSWLNEHKIPFDEIDDGSKGKPMADYYIDDKGIRFENNWPEVMAFVFDRHIQNEAHT